MFRDTKPFSGFAVDDLEKAKSFYGGTLGLEVAEEHGLLHLKLGSGAAVLVYPKPNHEPATFTILNFPVADIEAAVADLRAAGVEFEQYEGDLQTDEQGIFRGEGPPIAWFRDPSGNILSVLEQ